MLTKPRQIVLDKSAFLGINLKDLCHFAKSHLLLLSDTLLYECSTAKKQKPRSLLDRYETLVKAGAFYCSMSQHFIQWEAWHGICYPESLRDMRSTDCIRRGSVSISRILASGIPDHLHVAHTRIANTLFAQFSARMKSNVESHVQGVGAQLKTIPNTRQIRLVEWLRRIDRMDIHAMAVESLPAGWIRVSGEFCLSSAWMTWQNLRLVAAYEYEHWYIRQTSSPRDKWAEHDLEDVEYALLLSRADALITRDNGLGELARAAFPEKDVFSGLEEVPESYRCDWTNS